MRSSAPLHSELPNEIFARLNQVLNQARVVLEKEKGEHRLSLWKETHEHASRAIEDIYDMIDHIQAEINSFKPPSRSPSGSTKERENAIIRALDELYGDTMQDPVYPRRLLSFWLNNDFDFRYLNGDLPFAEFEEILDDTPWASNSHFHSLHRT